MGWRMMQGIRRTHRAAPDRYQQLCGGEGYPFDAPSNIAAQAALDTGCLTD